jgi:hypothetical protein
LVCLPQGFFIAVAEILGVGCINGTANIFSIISIVALVVVGIKGRQS